MRKAHVWGMTVVASLFLAVAAWAQSADDIVWVQIEARPSLNTALDRAEAYAQTLEDVNGFALTNGWYGIALGPYRRADAEQVLSVYRADGLIPSDSYISASQRYVQQFWPEGANVLNRSAALEVPQGTVSSSAPQAVTQEVEVVIDETPREARQSERLLTREERDALQIALRWAGFYNAAIDGAFGPGTRRAMSDWQRAEGLEPTGVLTTRQRARLLGQYNAILDGMNLQRVADVEAGIDMLIPTGVVAMTGREYPFVKFDETGDLPVQVLMISQAGDQTRLYGLYDIMQTLEIVPLDGRRERRQASFLLIGENDKIVSHTEVELQSGEIKGFTLVWPAGDEARRTRVLEEMRASFQRLDGALTPAWSTQTQEVDLVSGLQVRKPRLSRSGFFVDRAGTVLTTIEAVESCTRVTLDETTNATLAAANAALGLAVLTPEAPLAPRAFAAFAADAPRLQSDAVAAGFSFEGVLGAPTITYGQVADLRGLGGEPEITRLQIDTLDGDVGGPVFDQAGAVMGMLLPRSAVVRQLPQDVRFAVNHETLMALLTEAGRKPAIRDTVAEMAPEDITDQARDMTVLVSCWD